MWAIGPEGRAIRRFANSERKRGPRVPSYVVLALKNSNVCVF